MPELTFENIAEMLRPYPSPYPDTPIYDDNTKFKIGVISALNKFKKNHPYRVGEQKRIVGMMRLVMELSSIYNLDSPKLEFKQTDGVTDSYSSHYIPTENKIVMVGKLSIITLLHEFAHALGKDEHGAVKWSLSLFKRCYPKAFERLKADRHCLIDDSYTEVDNG